MKQVAIWGEQQAGLVEAPDPEPKEDWVVVKIHAAPMCTEYKLFLSGHKGAALGHEAAGEVVVVARSNRLKVGDRLEEEIPTPTPTLTLISATPLTTA